MQNPVKQCAIVLGGVNYSDSSRVVWVLTPDFGRQSFMVKGARRARSKYLGSLETFNRVSLIYRKREGGGLFTLREVDVEEHYAGIRRDLDAFWAASRAVELVKAVSQEEHESRELFELLDRFLALAQSAGPEGLSFSALLSAFRWRMAAVLGHEPRLLGCVRCGEEMSRAPAYRFLLARGGVFCPECAGMSGDERGSGYHAPGIEVSYPALRFIYRSSRRFMQQGGNEADELDNRDLETLDSLSRKYLSYHLGEERMAAGERDGIVPGGSQIGGDRRG